MDVEESHRPIRRYHLATTRYILTAFSLSERQSMDVLHALKKVYGKERKSALNRSYLTCRGIFLRITNSEKYWNELDTQEALLLDRGRLLLAEKIAGQFKSDDELKNYQWVMKNVNAKFTERGNFLLALVTLITALGLAKLNEVFGWVDGFWSYKIAFAITAVAVAFSVIDTVRLRNRAAIHEELINVIEKYIQTPQDVRDSLVQASRAAHPASPTTSVGMGRLAKVINRETYGGLFKAATVVSGVALIGMSQTGPILYDKELDAYAAKFKIEQAIGRPLHQIDCQLLITNKVDCQIAQHKIHTSNTSLDLLNTVVTSAMHLSFVLLVFAIFFFVASIFLPDIDENKNQPTTN